MQVSRRIFFQSFWALPIGFVLAMLIPLGLEVLLVAMLLPLAITLGTAHVPVPGPEDKRIQAEATTLAFVALALSVMSGTASMVVAAIFLAYGIIAWRSVEVRTAPPPGPTMSLSFAILLHIVLGIGIFYILFSSMAG